VTAKKFAESIRCIRQYTTQKVTAEMMPGGFSVRTLQAWESETRTPPAWVQVLVLDYLAKAFRDARGGKNNHGV